MAHTRESLIKALKKYAGTVKGKVTQAGFCRAEGMTTTRIYSCFPRGYCELLEAAGLRDRCARIARLTREDLMEELARVAAEIGSVPSRKQLERLTKYSISVYHSHFGGWDKVMEAYERFISERKKIVVKTIAPKVHGAAGRAGKGSGRRRVEKVEDVDRGVGTPLAFPGVLHAPTSESGVVHLFGLLGKATGIVVEHIGVAFPDCRGLRVDEKGVWRRIAIEFELKSSNFKMHRHDPEKCDLIVCWEHDWVECPVEVMELRSVVAGSV